MTNLGRQWLTLRYRLLDALLDESELQAPDPEDLAPLTEADLIADLDGRHSVTRFLNFYSRRGLETAAERLGLFPLLRRRGFKPRLQLQLTDPMRQLLRIYDGEVKPEKLLVEFAPHVEERTIRRDVLGDRRFRCLVVEWLLLQDPRQRFTAARPRLPGQEHPGLRAGGEAGEMILLIAARLRCDAVVTAPRHYHNGLLYQRRMRFIDPARQAEFIALERAVGHLPLAEASWAVALGCVAYRDGRPYTWPAADMIFPFADVLDEYVDGQRYRREVREHLRTAAFKLDEACFRREYAKVQRGAASVPPT